MHWEATGLGRGDPTGARERGYKTAAWERGYMIEICMPEIGGVGDSCLEEGIYDRDMYARDRRGR